MKKRFALLITLLTLMTLPAVAVKTVSVKELGALIADMQQQNKPDSNIADRLKGVNLSEQLTPAVIDEFRSMNLGPLSLEQIRILAVESALLPPPGTELPSTVAPDVDAQKGILGKTVNYISDFTHLPKLDADKTTVRYQDGPDYVLASNGGGTLMAQADIGQQFSPDNPYLRTLGQHTVAVEVMGGVELRPAKLKAGDPSTQNGQISQGGPGPVLGVAFEEAARGKLQFARWETVDGKPLAVFSYEVPKKQSHYEVNYCCFPKTENTGSHLGGPSGSSLTPGGGGGGGGAPSSYATLTTFDPFHAKVGYHGEFFIDPATGDVLRFIMEADLKRSDFVQQEDTRIDYAPAAVDGKTMLLPQASYVLTTVIPAGDSGQRIASRRTLFEVHYANYRQPAS